MSARRVAAVDIGTNSTRLLVADVADGRLDEVVRLLQITRLGQGVDAASALAPQAMERTLVVLRGYAELAAEHGAASGLATATSAVRDAANGREFLARVTAETGFATRLLQGAEEARTTFAGVLCGRPPTPGRLAVVDVGGGSTEVAIGVDGVLVSATSIDAGCVRATERWVGEGRVDRDRLATARAALERLFEVVEPGAVDACIAVAGTATTLAALDLELPAYEPDRIHGHVLTRAAVAAWLDRLAAMTLPERAALPVMAPGRAPVIVGGTVVLLTALDRLGVDACEVSERDILHGIALLAAG
jgi:exopolyphosphatase/guanosine-5'-triphosphate,3'-diphosphate pyrophosphatase